MGPFEQEVNQLHSEICAGLADPKRILILYALAEGSKNVTELAEFLSLPQPTTSRHLKLLRERGLVTSLRDGTSIYYSVADERIIQALDMLRAVLAERLQNQAGLIESFTNDPKA